jgi:hypothetical protein
MARAGGELAVVHRVQFAAHRLLGKRNAELQMRPLAQIDDPPAHNAMDRRGRAAFHDRRQRLPLRRIEDGRPARRCPVDQPIRSFGVEPDHPVPDDL